MVSTDITSEKTKSHTVYKTFQGKRVSSVTTIIGGQLGWNKRVLMAWQKRMAEQGEDPDKIRDKSASIGTLAHYMIECYLLDRDPEIDEYSKNDIDMATNALNAFEIWWKEVDLEFESAELRLVSQKHEYGGTIDMIARDKDGNVVVIDFKTSNGVYAEHIIQVAAYIQVFEEMREEKVKETYILQLSKESDSFNYHRIAKKMLTDGWRVFSLLLKLKPLQKKLRM